MITYLDDIDGVKVSYVGHTIPTSDEIAYILSEAKEYADIAKKTLLEIRISRSELFDTAAAYFIFGEGDENRVCKRFKL